jgi:hypothetical protein
MQRYHRNSVRSKQCGARTSVPFITVDVVYPLSTIKQQCETFGMEGFAEEEPGGQELGPESLSTSGSSVRDVGCQVAGFVAIG